MSWGQLDRANRRRDLESRGLSEKQIRQVLRDEFAFLPPEKSKI